MTPEASEARRQYLREWRKSHPENCKRYREAYWQKRATLKTATQPEGQADDDKQTSTN